jgi:Response regulator containing CheY-like receiver, AAA-type ATPase, and DNA-binding domains
MPFLTVLLAEDEPVISMDIQYLLEGQGCRVIQATASQDILAACEQYHPDLAILNFKQQDDGDGIELARTIMSRFMLPVAFITGARPQDIAASSDFDSSFDILYKPFSPAQLRQCVQNWIA